MKIKYCNCRSLVKTMILMQVFPSSAKRPKSGCHFALLDFLHLFKMNAHVSNHASADIMNQHLLILNNHNETKKLSKITLNFCYQLYRKTKYHVKEMLVQENKLVELKCYACANAEDMAIGCMDGNFGQGRLNINNEANTSFFGIPGAVTKYWGCKDEVERFAPHSTGDGSIKEDYFLEDLENNFKAASNTARNTNQRFDENGVFGLFCGRHGVPLKMFDIYGGEGRKYALAAVSQFPEAIYLFKRLEVFPQLKDKGAIYAVPIFHAFAHVMSCQLKYHPRYVKGFGNADGEGSERYWSYTDGFIPMIRSMMKDNRHFLLTEAALHFTNLKIMELQLEGIFPEEKYNNTLPLWNDIVKSMSVPITDKYLKNIVENINDRRPDANDSYESYISNSLKLIAFDEIENKNKIIPKKNRITTKRRNSILVDVLFYENEIDTRVKRPTSKDDTRVIDLELSLNIEIASMYQTLFYDHITMILMKEIMLNKTGKNGTRKAARIMQAAANLRTTANSIIQALNEHVTDSEFSQYIKDKYCLSTVARSTQKLREFNEKQRVNLSQDFLDLHELMRAREEIVFLETESARLLDNLKLKADPIKEAINTLNQKDVKTVVEVGKLYILKEMQSAASYTQQKAKNCLSLEVEEVRNVELDEVEEVENEEE
ncbi:hypothetical protein BD770DRAFT_468949 [Pilaira anomala]|nr:hypothetical protein BD770DRAFT_468949 [Pilaira anomala]